MAIENLANWESRVPVHIGPGGCDLDSFDHPEHITNVVRYDLSRRGRLDGLDVVHLQCHVCVGRPGAAMKAPSVARGFPADGIFGRLWQ